MYVSTPFLPFFVHILVEGVSLTARLHDPPTPRSRHGPTTAATTVGESPVVTVLLKGNEKIADENY